MYIITKTWLLFSNNTNKDFYGWINCRWETFIHLKFHHPTTENSLKILKSWSTNQWDMLVFHWEMLLRNTIAHNSQTLLTENASGLRPLFWAPDHWQLCRAVRSKGCDMESDSWVGIMAIICWLYNLGQVTQPLSPSLLYM